jgi:hypothetical protein
MINHKRVRLSKLSIGLALALAAAPAFAQNTSAALGGTISGADGQPVSGASVTITHTESGTVSNTTTDATGNYLARGLRVGGPYTVTITKDGQTTTREGVYLALGETSDLDAQLSQAVELGAVTVVGTGGSVFSSTAMGAGTNLSNEQLNNFPSIQRDLQDYARLDPRLSQTDKERGEISAMGQNTRFNSITVDSVSVNDTFGLEANNLPTIRQPISMDAIQAVQINVTNYDTTQRGYTGANINAVTKSGTNDWRGSVYGTYRTKDWVREEDDREVIFNRFDTEQTWGVTFGGPIMRDRLFFFVNYEKTTLDGVAPDLSTGPLGAGTVTAADLVRIRDIALFYGLDTGLATGATTLEGLFSVPAPSTEVETWLARFDWNLTDSQRLAFRFSQTDQNEGILPGFGSTFFSLPSHWYDQQKSIDSYVLELFSDWSDSFSTEMHASLRNYESVPKVFMQQPQVQVDFGSSNLRFGTEQFRHVNVLETDTLNLFAAGTLFRGDHEFKFGIEHEVNDIYNLFLESNAGQWRFRSVNDFDPNDCPTTCPPDAVPSEVVREYVLRTSPTGNPEDAAAEATFDNTGVFAQDTWTVNNNLTLTYGFRYDMAGVDDEVPYNAAFETAYGFANTETIDGTSEFQPRFGFNYTFDHDRPMQLRGGIGKFQGASANVWLINSFTNPGTTIQVFGCGTTGFPSCSGVQFDPFNPPEIGSARMDVDVLEPGFEQPSVWKANLAFEHELPFWGVVGAIEAIFTSVDKGIYYEHLNLGTSYLAGPDDRVMYWSNPNSASGSRNGSNPLFREVMLARNTNKGDGQNLTVSLSKPFRNDENFSWSLAYSYTEATEVSGLTSSRAISNWRSRAGFDVNENVASRSPYVNRDRFTATGTWKHNFFGEYETQISAFFEARNGKPYSWVYSNDMNGDGQGGNDLMYLPDVGEAVFTNATLCGNALPCGAAEVEFWDIVATHDIGARGEVVKRNSAFAPWANTLDLRISQELPGFFRDHKSEIWVDVLNVGNLINKDWGLIDEVGFQSDGGQARSFVNFRGIDGEGRYIYEVQSPEEALLRRDNRGESRWGVQVGFRYSF